MRRIVPLALTSSFSLLLASCGPKPPARPDFMLNPPHEAGKFFGSAEAQKKTFQLAKDIADSRACADVAKQLGQRVQRQVKDFQEQSGVGADAEYLEFSQVVSKNITDQNLAGCEILKREERTSEDGVTVYSLAYVDKTTAQTAVRSALMAAKSKAAAKIAFDDLDKAIEANLDK